LGVFLWVEKEKDRQAKKFLKKVGLTLRRLRTKNNWTLEDTEEHGWVSWQHLQKLESGKDMNLSSLYRLSKLYKVHPWEILKDD
jgi:transcriptional regulator with XRE-family HTH domain